MASSTVENYLKQLYLEEHSTGKSIVPMGRLAELMKVVPGTATAMVKALADSGLVRYSPRAGVRLTPAGNQLALHVLRRHRLVELFLVKIVGFDWSEVHDEAEELEHVISEKLLERIDSLLGHPTVDPHGDPIPTAGGHVAYPAADDFVNCPLRRRVQIVRILDQQPRFLQFVNQCGLLPGTRVQVSERNPQADSVSILLEGKSPLTLSTAAAAKFQVKPVA
ncbi:MAG TPA: metal-dependent transcriptional regulator [Phycisphaerae bacterium]|nr:metal-dependent transcriptional regulator [Phycisphaerae bacterium]